MRLGDRVAEAGDDRQVGGAAAEPDRADARLVAALLVAQRPAAVDEDRADPVQRALRQLQLAGEVAEPEGALRHDELHHAQRRVDAGRPSGWPLRARRQSGTAAVAATVGASDGTPAAGVTVAADAAAATGVGGPAPMRHGLGDDCSIGHRRTTQVVLGTARQCRRYPLSVLLPEPSIHPEDAFGP